MSDIEEHVQELNKELKLINKLSKNYKALGCQESIYIFSKKNWFRRSTFKIVQWHNFETIILVLIVLSSCKLAFDTYFADEPTNESEELVYNISNALDYIFNICFAIECGLKIISFGFCFGENSYLTDTWNQMDFIIVFSSIIDMTVTGVDL